MIKFYNSYIFHRFLFKFRIISCECWIMKIPINVPQDRNPIIERRWVWTMGNWSWLLMIYIIILRFIINGRESSLFTKFIFYHLVRIQATYAMLYHKWIFDHVYISYLYSVKAVRGMDICLFLCISVVQITSMS